MGRKKVRDYKQYTLNITNNYFYNLQEIVDYISFEKHQSLNAIKIGNGINKAMSKIIENPLLYSDVKTSLQNLKFIEKQLIKRG